MPYRSLREEELRLRLGWFVKIRWFFVVGFTAAALFARFALELRFPFVPVLLALASILVYNAGFYFYHRARRRRRPAPNLVRRRVEAHLQIYLDLLHLTLLIHLLGGVECPFLSFYLFHAILGSMLLSRLEVLILGLASLLLCAGVVAFEYVAFLPHHRFVGVFAAGAHRDPLTLVVVGSAFCVMLFATIAMSSTIVASLHQREKELVAVREALGAKSEALERANQTLREHQETMIRTEKLASLGELSAGIAHEINNPIQFIQGNMQILREAMQDILPILDGAHRDASALTVARLDYPFFREQIGVLIDDMAGGAARIRDIVKDLKTFARRDEGRFSEDVDLNELIRSSLRLLHNRLKHYQVEEALDPRLPLIEGNASRLEQVIINTLVNAMEATGSQGGRIRIRSGQESGGDEVRVSVEDNGHGISDDVKRRIFDPFFTTKTRAGGSGLGLTISYAIAQEHAGRIDLESELGKGATFHLVLPVKRSAT